MESEFSTYAFADLLSNIVDNRGKTCPVAESGLPLIATNCVKNETLYPSFEKVRYVDAETYGSWFRGHPEPGDLIFVCKGAPGNVCWTPDPVNFCIAQDMVGLRANEELINPKFLFALLRHPGTQAQILNMHVGTMIPHFKKGDFKNLFLQVLDDKGVQRAIGEIYFAFCQKIELNRRMNETLESMARALFKSWFVDFDPVIDNALAAGNPIPEPLSQRAQTRRDLGTHRKPLPKNIQKLFPDAFAFDEIMGWVPESWTVQPLSNIADVVMGTSPKSSTYNDAGEGTPLVNGPVEFGNRFTVRRKWTTAPTRFSEANDLIFCVRGSTTGRRVYSDGVYCLGRGVCAMRSKNDHQAFVNQTIESELPRILSGVNGSVFPNLNGPQLKGFPVVVPCESLLTTFSEIVNDSLSKLASNVRESATLTKLRDTLLPKLLSGELRIPDAEKLVADSL